MFKTGDSRTEAHPLTTLISARELETQIRAPGSKINVKLLDCRSRLGDPEYGERVFAEGHLPGAVQADLDHFWAAPAGVGGRHPLPEPHRLVAQLQAAGLNTTDQFVVYDDASGAFAARAWWCLRWLGHRQVAVLDGGIGAWQRPLCADTPGENPPIGDFERRPSLTRIATVGDVASRTANTTLLDARAIERFAGEMEPIDSIAGHIPGARCLPFRGNLDDRGHFRSAEELAMRFADVPEPVICYCGSGVTAAHNLLAMVHAQRGEPALYVGSWSEWITDRDRPIATGL